MAGNKLSKNQKRRLKKKLAKERAAKAAAEAQQAAAKAEPAKAVVKKEDTADVIVEYVPDTDLKDFLEKNGVALTSKEEEGADLGLESAAPDFALEFKSIFEKFQGGAAEEEEKEEKKKKDDDDSDDDEDGDEEDTVTLSNRKRRKMNRLTIAQLKQLVARPDVVEAHDVTSSDPRLLVFLKAYRNTVPVPRHWCAKRKYLQGKRGIERLPFELPDFIADTGIGKIRAAVNEMEANKTAKQLQRERVQPKMGKINIDYQVLHDAFFKFQTKPSMTDHGDIYYEGKEFEVKMKNIKPGRISDSLKQALGMPDGAPPPWLINMQRYGPPPAYPRLKIPGLNYPIPAGCSYGYHPGGWGRPPVDEAGRPLYGDPFGTGDLDEDKDEEVDKSRWGELEEDTSDEESESESDADDASDMDEDEEEEETGPGTGAGTETPMIGDGTSTMVSGMATPATIDLRKGLRKTGMDTPVAPTPELYQVLQSQSASVGANALMGSSARYVVPGAAGTTSLDPSQLEKLDDATLQARFAAQGTSDTKEGRETESRKRKRKEEREAHRSSKRAREKFKF